MFDSILVVCTGNICRSPIGERILQRAFPGKIIKSAGTGALVGQNADRQAYNVASQNGLSLDGHKGRQFTSSLSREY
ncbi:TPA: protein tyrosine phosphatase, partial [Klebsiella pneumoniae]|nr:protein tyrosine phosphatase [Klebsiella pneumoniae]